MQIRQLTPLKKISTNPKKTKFMYIKTTDCVLNVTASNIQ